MDSSALGSELRKNLKKKQSSSSLLKIERPTPTPSPPPITEGLQTSPQRPATAKTPSMVSPERPAASKPLVSPEKPLVPRVFLEDAGPPLPVVQEESLEEDVGDNSFSKSPAQEKAKQKQQAAAKEEEDNWDDSDTEVAAPSILLTREEVEPYVCMVQELRQFFATLLPNKNALDQELGNGIALCKQIARFLAPAEREQCLSEISSDYSPALAVVSEWKNCKLFCHHLFQKYPKLSVIFHSGSEEAVVSDLLNRTNVPRFFSLLLAFAKESGSLAKQEQQLLPRPGEADMQMLQSHALEKWQVALKRFREGAFDQASLQHPVYLFLKSCALEEYFMPCIELGWDTLERLALLGKEDCQQFCAKPGHVRQLLTACKQLSMATLQSSAERVYEFHPSNNVLPTDEFWLREERTRLAQLHQVRVSKQNSTFPAFRDALQCTDYLLSLTSVPSVSTTAILDFTNSSTLLFGFAGASAPMGQLELLSGGSGTTKFEIFRDGVTRALERLGKAQIKRLFLVGVSMNAAVLDYALELCAHGVFLCGPKSTSCIAMRVFGLMDGVCVDFDPVEKTAKAFAIKQGQVLPHATIVAAVENEEDLSSTVSLCLQECSAKPGNSRVKGGLVISGGGRRTVSKQVAERFSCGLFHLQLASSRWACASQLAVHPNFQHRWMVRPKSATATAVGWGLEDALFPLVSFEHRKALVSKSMCALHVLHRILMEEEAAANARQQKEEEVPAPAAVTSPTSKASPPKLPAHRPAAAAGASRLVPTTAAAVSPAIPPPPAASAASATSRNKIVATTEDKFEKMRIMFEDLAKLLPKPDFLLAKTFILSELSQSKEPTQNLMNLSLADVISRLPPEIKSKLNSDVIVLSKEEEEELSAVL